MLTDSRLILQRLNREGWTLIRTRGSHHVLRHPTTRATVIVQHPRKDLPTGTLNAIYKQAGWLRD